MVKEYSMWVEPLPNGKFKYRQKYPDPLKSTPDKIVFKTASVTLTKNTKQAHNKARQILQEKIAKKLNDQKQLAYTITIGELFEKYRNKILNENKPYHTRLLADISLNKFEQHFGSKIIAANIKTPMLANYFDDLLFNGNNGKGYSNSTIHIREMFPNLAYKNGVRIGLLKSNPFDNLVLTRKDETKLKEDRIENKYLTDEEYHAILNACLAKNKVGKQPHKSYYDLFVWLYETGMRIGEAISLSPSDIVEENNRYYAMVTGTLELHNNNGHPEYIKSSSPKTRASLRKVFLPQGAVEIYKRHQNSKPFLFMNDVTGNPFSTNGTNLVLKILAKKCHIQKNVTTHFFRHTHVSKLAEKGLSLEMISKRVGHSNSKITKDIYFHVTQKMQSDFEDKIKDFK